MYDENSDREMIVTQEQMDVFTNGVELHHYFLYNMSKYPEDASHACEVANKLRAYINEHIDAEGKPIYVIDNMYCFFPDINLGITTIYLKLCGF